MGFFSVRSGPEAEAPGLVFSAPFFPSGRLYEPEAASHFKKVHRLLEDGENRPVFQRSQDVACGIN
ncbi:MAG: hypothetical protein ACQEQO_01065 [Thermodesulfobacteriota bacterium]